MIRNSNPDIPMLEKRLEEKFAHRNLGFNTMLTELGGHSTYGVIDGMRFEFKVQSDCSFLHVGIMDDDESMRIHERRFGIWNSYMEALDFEVAHQLHTDEEAEIRYQALQWVKPELKLETGETDSPVHILLSSKELLNPAEYRDEEITEDEMERIFSDRVQSLRIQAWKGNSGQG